MKIKDNMQGQVQIRGGGEFSTKSGEQEQIFFKFYD